MTKEQIAVFTRRIAGGNPTQIICVLFDVYKANEVEALEAIEGQDKKKTMEAIRKCEEVVMHLRDALNFKYEISRELFSLYDFVLRALAKSGYQMTDTGLKEAQLVMNELKDAFEGVAKQDDTKPVMGNTQKVVAGMTYGRYDINETMQEGEGTRGFLA